MFKLCWTFNIAMRRRGSFLLYFVICACQWSFLSDPGVPGVRSMGPSLSNWGRFCRYNWCDSAFWRYQLNTNNNANRAIQGNVTMQVMQPGGQICNICKCCHLMANFGTNASGATWWPNFEKMQVVPHGSPIFNWCRRHHQEAKIVTDASFATWWLNL